MCKLAPQDLKHPGRQKLKFIDIMVSHRNIGALKIRIGCFQTANFIQFMLSLDSKHFQSREVRVALFGHALVDCPSLGRCTTQIVMACYNSQCPVA